MNRLSILIPVFIVVVAIIIGFWFTSKNVSFKNTPPVACTMEAKICPDGTSVGRTGPNCEFAACPNPSADNGGVLVGKVILGPTCPVETTPPDPRCAPKPYLTKIEAFSVDGTELVKTVQNQSDGSFVMNLPAGDYSIKTGGEVVYPRCISEPVTIQPGVTTSIDITCDTGIR